MEKMLCTPCGYVYDPEVGDPDRGILPGTPFAELPSDWVCPVCLLGEDVFEPYKEKEPHHHRKAMHKKAS